MSAEPTKVRKSNARLYELLCAGVVENPTSGCHEWQKARMSTGYGWMSVGGGVVELAHRISWQIANGAIPKGLHVLHKCDNRVCVNPLHLFLGTDADNAADRDGKGRCDHPRGGDHYRAKISEQDVPIIRAMYADGVPLRKIGAQFGIAGCTVYQIAKGAIWRHVTNSI